MVFIKARKLLLKPNTSISSVSGELDFCGQFYFSRRFSENIGRTPSQFKSENKLKNPCKIKEKISQGVFMR